MGFFDGTTPSDTNHHHRPHGRGVRKSASRCLSGRDGLLGESPRPVGGAAGEGRLPAGRGCPGFPEDGVTMPFRKLQEAGAIQGLPGRCGLTLRAGWGDRAVTRERAAFSSPGWPAADSSAGAVEVAVAFDMRVVVTGGDLALHAEVLALPATGRQLAAGASAMWTASGAPRSCEPWVPILPCGTNVDDRPPVGRGVPVRLRAGPRPSAGSWPTSSTNAPQRPVSGRRVGTFVREGGVTG